MPRHGVDAVDDYMREVVVVDGDMEDFVDEEYYYGRGGHGEESGLDDYDMVCFLLSLLNQFYFDINSRYHFCATGTAQLLDCSH